MESQNTVVQLNHYSSQPSDLAKTIMLTQTSGQLDADNDPDRTRVLNPLPLPPATLVINPAEATANNAATAESGSAAKSEQIEPTALAAQQAILTSLTAIVNQSATQASVFVEKNRRMLFPAVAMLLAGVGVAMIYSTYSYHNSFNYTPVIAKPTTTTASGDGMSMAESSAKPMAEDAMPMEETVAENATAPLSPAQAEQKADALLNAIQQLTVSGQQMWQQSTSATQSQ